MHKMLSVQHVSKTFNRGTVNEKLVLDDISLDLAEGDFVTVVGGNGAGKSTLLNAIAGSITIDSGTIFCAGDDITQLPEHKRANYFGRVFQDPLMGTAASMQIQENLALAALRGKKRGLKWSLPKAQQAHFKELLRGLDLGLEERLTTQVGLLSGGQRQALCLLMATIVEPKILLLDEHIAALDPKTAAKVMELSNRVVEEHGLTALMITHNMAHAIQYGNRLVMLESGRVAYQAEGEEKSKLTVPQMLELFQTQS